MADTTTSALNWATVENGKVKTTTSKKSDESNNGTMGYDQFLTLLCAEMQYQDPLEPTSNTEYVAQLATFSQLEAMLGMQDTQKNEMANNLVGKYVILKVSDETTGKTSYVDGKVDYVMYQEDGKVKTTTSKKSDESNNGTMGYDQFLTLLCAEMQYQDPLEPTSNTEYVAQLATFSQLEAMLGMQDTQKNEMANNLVGKYVILKVSDETTGKTSYVDGKVDYVMYQEDGSQMLSVNNKLYSIDTLDTVADSDYYEAIGYAKTISNMLAQLPDIENITTKYSGAIEQIRKVYDGMTDYQKSFVSESDLAKLKKYEQKIKDLGGDTSDDTKTDDTKTDTDTKTDDTKTDTDTKTDDTKTDDSKTENGSGQKSDETTGA